MKYDTPFKKNTPFRAFCKSMKKMTYYVDVYSVGDDWWWSGSIYDEDYKNEISDFDNGDGILMRNTWLPDREGEFIYEGDIVRTHEPDEGRLLEVVIFENGCFKLNCKSDETKINYPVGSLRNTFIKVIGNIYENPELL